MDEITQRMAEAAREFRNAVEAPDSEDRYGMARMLLAREKLNACLAAYEAAAKAEPVAWFRVVRTSCNHEEEPMYEPEIHWHRERPNGHDWIALHTNSPPLPEFNEAREREAAMESVRHLPATWTFGSLLEAYIAGWLAARRPRGK